MSSGILRHLRDGSDLVDQSFRASRVASARAEKALHLARTLELRAREADDGTPYLAQASSLRADAVAHSLDARRHREAAEALRVWVSPADLA
jgi:hypothetical protein